MPVPRDDSPRFIVKMALRKALKLVRSLRRQITDLDEDVMTANLIEELDISGWEIRKIPGRSAGFTFEAPDAPPKGSQR
jgi:hypothetical protein